ncbi:hypothetical protein HO133_006665 [Letharia lupina]|uniref:Glycosyl transferase family 25 domain-containing protein n=1 Tax=Letharia lupina TaxID=560253 RepID=A0A8H6F7H2_9LECA|nr:uncharacterized protein HO133_006665 [Letharia lupina]KAF6217563.1 hypothetical protein HO133_006665 [Letharia lupina]
MSEYIKSTLANLPQKVHSLQSLSSYRLSLLNIQFPTINFQGKGSLPTRNPRAFIIFAFLLFLLFWKDIIRDVCSHVATRRLPVPVVEVSSIRNNTLGFQNIFVLSLPERGDRRTPLLAAANATNLTLTVLDAIRDRQIPQSDWPQWWGTNTWVPKDGELGCLMSHVRTWRKMIHENISTALIMESDVDWDMRIKDTMVGVGDGVKAIADWPFPDPQHPRDFSKELSPYGDKWDLMWIGHCGINADGDGRIYAFNDSSAADEDHAWNFGERPAEGHRPPGTRIVFQPRKTVCTTSYAMSLAGARKFEKLFKEANSPIDLKLWDHCEHDPTTRCVGTWPQVISMTESKTNIKHSGGGLSFGHEVTEEKIVAGNAIQISARVNAHLGLADKGPTKWKSEWVTGEKKKEETADDFTDKSD